MKPTEKWFDAHESRPRSALPGELDAVLALVLCEKMADPSAAAMAAITDAEIGRAWVKYLAGQRAVVGEAMP